ncbi:hypothetical protein K4G91_23470, partial [Mycobacterium tuberculosis]|uniref:hypothetical protein n=1 Tax=Mycobacterium tuberculosis TaxID=1773 RepID=UPI001C7D5AAF|nr:hypothetical protein [Mycobacterium tuberculosis]
MSRPHRAALGTSCLLASLGPVHGRGARCAAPTTVTGEGFTGGAAGAVRCRVCGPGIGACGGAGILDCPG